jgi:ATP-binding cassette subfamily B protein
VVAVLLAALGMVFELAVVARMMALPSWLRDKATPVIYLGLVLLLFGLDLACACGTRFLGRRFEMRMRRSFCDAVPRVSTQYFGSRLLSDLAHRAFKLKALVSMPETVLDALRHAAVFAIAAFATALLYRHGVVLAIAMVAAAIGFAASLEVLVDPREARQMAQALALGRFFVDGLVGRTVLARHRAGAALRVEHESALAEWARSGLAVSNTAAWLCGIYTACALAGVLYAVRDVAAQQGLSPAVLVLLYLGLRLYDAGVRLAMLLRTFPRLRQVVLRIAETIDRADPCAAFSGGPGAFEAGEAGSGIALRFDRVSVSAGGQPVLADVDIAIAAGEHVAVVGMSGAGKSTLLGLLLGVHTAASGAVLADGVEMTEATRPDVRRAMAWVDPQTQLWNTSLADNVAYGADKPAERALDEVRELAGLAVMVRRIDPYRTPLGQDGNRLSGGEGQRVRFARALAREGVRLALLDEPFRGLEASARQALLREARARWAGATLLFASHDIRDTLAFDRVLVLSRGRVVEDDAPAALAARESHYARLIAAHDARLDAIAKSAGWRWLTLADGTLSERAKR